MSAVRTVRLTQIRQSRRVRLTFAAVCVALACVLPSGAVYAEDPPTQSPPGSSAQPTPEAPLPEAPTNTRDNGSAQPSQEERVEAVIAAARAYLGTPYKVGTEGPHTIDCSGLVFRTFANAGELGQIGGARLRAAGYMRWFAAHGLLTTDAEQAERGDLVMYDNGGHIGIYLGEGRVISAVVTGVTVHALEGISVPLTGFLAVDWTGKRGPFRDAVIPQVVDEPEAPVALVPPVAWAPEVLAEEEARGPAIVGEERVDMRTANSRTFEDADGRFTTEIFSRPIHYLPAESTEWQPIDLRFHEATGDGDDASGGVLADTAPVTVLAGDPRAEGSLLAVSAGELAVALTAARVSRDSAEPELGDDGRFLDYRDLFAEGVGLRVFPRADGFKAFLVFADEPAARSFKFDLDAGDLTAVAEIDGSITLRDAAGLSLGRLVRPMLLDSSDTQGNGGGVRANVVTVVPSLTDAGETQVTLSIERAALNEAVYPAFVDLALVDFPTTSTAAAHTFASSTHADANFSTYQRPEAPGYAELWHGRRPGRQDYNAAYLRFPGLATLLNGTTVESASLAALPYWQGSGEEASSSWLGRVSAEWDVRTLTWNTRPVASPDEATYDTVQGQWSAIDLTSYVQEVAAGTAVDYGLVLHADDAGRGHWKRLVAESSAGAGALEPRLVVNWSGLRPVAASTAEVVDSTAVLSWTASDLAPAPLRVQFQVSSDDFATVLAGFRAKGRSIEDGAVDFATEELEPGTYAWRVRATYVEDGGWSPWSDSGTFVVADAIDPVLDNAHDALTAAPPVDAGMVDHQPEIEADRIIVF